MIPPSDTESLAPCSEVEYLNSRDATIMGSRNGHAPIYMWYTLTLKGYEGMRRDVEKCLRNAHLLKAPPHLQQTRLLLWEAASQQQLFLSMGLPDDAQEQCICCCDSAQNYCNIKGRAPRTVVEAAEVRVPCAVCAQAMLEHAGIKCMLNELSSTVVFERPKDETFVRKWQLACEVHVLHMCSGRCPC